MSHRRYGLRLLIALLVCVYTLTNAGRFHIIDEVSLFALTESVALRGALDTNAIAWSQWVNSPAEVLGAFGPDGQVFSKKGPAPALLAVPWYLLLRWLTHLDNQVGLLQGALLWNGVVTALTAALLWLTTVRLGYRDEVGALLALLFGLCTIAWPYANHFFGEPLSAWSLLTCFYGVFTYGQSGRLRWLWLAGGGAGVALMTVTAHGLLIGVLGLYWLWLALWVRWVGVLPFLFGLLIWALPMVVAALFLLWYNAVRFGDPWTTGYHFASGEGFTTPFWEGFWGLIVSPYRGFFWYTPLFFASLVAFAPFVRRHRSQGVVFLALSLVLIALYSTWWIWWGGFAWGPRFLVPLAPFWVLVLAPVAEQLTRSAGQVARVANTTLWSAMGEVLFIACVVISLAVQVLAVAVNYVNYEIQLRALFPTDWNNPLAFGAPAQKLSELSYSPVFGQWNLLRNAPLANSDLAWLTADGVVYWATLAIGLAAIATLIIALRGWWCAGQASQPLPGAPMRWLLPSLAVVVMGVWLSDSRHDPTYGEPNQGYRAILSEICQQMRPDDAVLTVAPYRYHIPMNWLGGLCREGAPIFGYAADSISHPEAQQVMTRLLQVYRRIWFVTDGLPANAPDNAVERWLADVAYKADDRWFNDYRLVRYATPRGLQGAPKLSLDLLLHDSQNQQVTIVAVQAPTRMSRGEILPVEIGYQLEQPLTANLRWFVQLLASNGTAVALTDTAPGQSYVLFSALPAGEALVERVGVQLPPELEAGEYRLIAGLYNPDAPAPNRLLTPVGRDYVDLGAVRVQE
jgi:hypothetical protein